MNHRCYSVKVGDGLVTEEEVSEMNKEFYKTAKKETLRRTLRLSGHVIIMLGFLMFVSMIDYEWVYLNFGQNVVRIVVLMSFIGTGLVLFHTIRAMFRLISWLVIVVSSLLR